MSENFERRRPKSVSRETPKKKYRDIRVERIQSAPLVIDRYVKCDGETHIVELDKTFRDDSGDIHQGTTELTGESSPCDCDDGHRNDSVWDIFHSPKQA